METPFELAALEHAHRYSKWIYSSVAPYLGQRILELGAGIGNLSQWLPRRELLVVTEADEALMPKLKAKLTDVDDRKVVLKKIDLSRDLGAQVQSYGIDTIVSFNVMEHIDDDLSAFRDQIKILKESPAVGPKRLVVFVPAHAFAYGSYDKIFQHFRRYSARDLRKKFSAIDSTLQVQTFYFNLMSLPGWIWMGRVKKSVEFKPSQIKLVEMLIPFWKPFDHFIHHVLRLPLGQSVVAVVNVVDE